MQIRNGSIWYDTDGNVLHAHGGYMLKQGDYYYWYGEDRTGDNYVNCYRSTDLVHWEFRNHILTTHSRTEPIRHRTDLRLLNQKGGKVNLERPKVLYNENTKKYVLWVHYENGVDYRCAAAAIATCDTPDGLFTYHGSFNPYGYMSRDCTLYQENGTAYFLSASRDNADLHVYRLTEDYMNVECLVNKLWQGEYREAPAVMKKDGMYYIMSSYCTGWAPNQGKYATGTSIEGSFGLLKNIGDSTTYDTQPAFILPIHGSEETSYLYVADRWDGKDYFNSRYVFLPLQFEDDGTMSLEYADSIEVSVETGRISANSSLVYKENKS